MTPIEAAQKGSEELLIHMLMRHDGWYECPVGADGKRLGPLVGYTGRNKRGDQFVGDVYLNAARLENNPTDLFVLAQELESILRSNLSSLREFTFCGAPMGGLSLSCLLAFRTGARYIYAEKKVTALATDTSREKSELIFGRHEPQAGDRVIIGEDVCNNYSTTRELIALIQSRGATVVGIACLANRSMVVRGDYEGIPIFTLLDKAIPQYEQDDPAVADDIAARNVVWKPKGVNGEWARLMAAMNTHRQSE